METIKFFNSDQLSADLDITVEERSVLDTINRTVAGGKSLDEILYFVFDVVRQLMSCDRIDVAFVEDDFQRMVLRYVKADYQPVYLKRGFATDIAGGSIRKVFSSGLPSVISDMEKHAGANPESESARLLVKEGIRSSMVCPLSVDGRHIAMLMSRSKKKNAYYIREIRFQMAFAERLSQAVEKAFHIELLRSSIDSYMEMLSFVSHELRSPLSSIIMLTETLYKGYFGPVEPRQKEIIDQILKKTEYLLNLTGEYLNLATFESGQFSINPAEVDFYKDVIAHSLETVSTMLTEKGIKLQQETEQLSGKVKCDKELMKIVMTNLLSNAVKYGNKGGIIKLILLETDAGIRVTVWNEGPGFPESEKIKLFRKFSKIETPELKKIKGHGVGLYVTWKIVLLHGGQIRADSVEGEWAEFTFEIPLRMDQCFI